MVDRYTKFVLTAIALALFAQVAPNIIRPASAQLSGGVVEVQICDANGYDCAGVSHYTVSTLGVNLRLPGLDVISR